MSYRPLELRAPIEQAMNERRPIRVGDVVLGAEEGDRCLDVQVSPLFLPSGESGGVSIAFTDVTRHRALQTELEEARRSLETAYEELQSTVEELETTNEELQSTNEELETTNEELQSTNEELETMNEELQSTNEELEAMNDELRERTDDVMRSSSFLSSILANIHQAVVVVDRELRIAEWSRPATELWGLRPDEAEGEHLLNLDIGLPVNELRGPIRNVLAGREQRDVVLRAHNRRGQPVVCTVSFTQLVPHHDGSEGVILVMSAEPDPGHV
jgi:two-component system CheB/CheR fusion protein